MKSTPKVEAPIAILTTQTRVQISAPPVEVVKVPTVTKKTVKVSAKPKPPKRPRPETKAKPPVKPKLASEKVPMRGDAPPGRDNMLLS